MKTRITSATVKASYEKIIVCGYGNLQDMLAYENPVAYNNGVYGWNYDVYEINPNCAIVTGYRCFNSKYKPGYDLQKKYNDAARKIRCDYSIGYEEQKARLKEIIRDFVGEVTGGK